jgi:hypothetical protein
MNTGGKLVSHHRHCHSPLLPKGAGDRLSRGRGKDLIPGARGEMREADMNRVPGTSRWCLSQVGQQVRLTLKGVRLRTILSPVLAPHMWQWPQTLVTKERSSSAGGA